ncbi:MAG: potassium channel family protein, partial [Methanoregula sp.]|nr:potassium channel family protein [Methanoregula sp.]
MTSDLLRERLKPIHRYKTVLPLVFLLAFILIFPFFEQFRIGDALLVVIMTGLLISSVYNVSEHPREIAITLLLMIPTALTTWANFFVHSRDVYLIQIVSVIIFLVYTQTISLRRVMLTRHVTENEIFSAVSVYIMIGLAYAFTYQFIELVNPGTFLFGSGGSSFSALIYFSFTTLATVGFGDVSAITPLARSVAILEMITGVMYLAIFVGVLVNAHYRFRDELWDKETGAKKEEKGHGIFRSGGPVSLIIIAVLVDIASAITMRSLQIPLYFNTWGTSLAVIHSGFPAGAIAAILYSLIMATTARTPIVLIWSAGGILIAAMTWVFWKKGWIDMRHPARILAAGLMNGAASAILIIAMTAIFGLSQYSGTLVVSQFFTTATGSS